MPVIDVNESMSEKRTGMVRSVSAPITPRVAEEIFPTSGLLCVPGTADEEAALPASAADVARAIGVNQYLTHKAEDASGNEFAALDVMSILQGGVIAVAVEDAVASGDQPYARHTAPGAEQVGSFRSDDDGGNAAPVPNCRYVSSTTGAGVAWLSVNLPHAA